MPVGVPEVLHWVWGFDGVCGGGGLNATRFRLDALRALAEVLHGDAPEVEGLDGDLVHSSMLSHSPVAEFSTYPRLHSQ